MIESSIDPDFFRQPFRIGSLDVKNRVLLSPLAGVSDVPFRRICSELGAGLCCVEMMSCIGVARRTTRTMHMLRRHDDESQLAVQVTGATPEELVEAAQVLDAENFDTIDLNMGCPVRKIVNKGWGSAILREPQRVHDMILRVRETVNVPVTAKIRLGWSAKEINVEQVSEKVAEAGAALLTIHGRSRGDTYKVPVDYPAIRRGIEAARAVGSIVTMGNGNVMDYDSAVHMVRETGCDAVLISRGALGNPWIFRQILEGHDEQPTISEWRDVVLRHVDYVEENYGDREMSAICFRKHLLWYVSGFPNSRKWRPELVRVGSLDEIRSRIAAFAESLPPDLPRFHIGSTWKGEGVVPDFDPKFDMDRKHDRGVEVEE